MSNIISNIIQFNYKENKLSGWIFSYSNISYVYFQYSTFFKMCIILGHWKIMNFFAFFFSVWDSNKTNKLRGL
jgi:hypothetical protein